MCIRDRIIFATEVNWYSYTLHWKRRSDMSRFAVYTEEQVTHEIAGRIPKNTQNKCKWAITIFLSWFEEWRTRLDGGLKMLKEISEFKYSDLNFCLKHFFAEVRKQNQERYPPEILKALANMIHFHFRTQYDWNISIFTAWWGIQRCTCINERTTEKIGVTWKYEDKEESSSHRLSAWSALVNGCLRVF